MYKQLPRSSIQALNDDSDNDSVDTVVQRPDLQDTMLELSTFIKISRSNAPDNIDKAIEDLNTKIDACERAKPLNITNEIKSAFKKLMKEAGELKIMFTLQLLREHF